MTAKKRSVAQKDDATAPARKKATPRKTVARKKAATKKTTAQDLVSAQDLFKMIQEAAYFAAINDNFSGNPTSYWLEAEREVRQRLS